ncbi:MAG: translation initiation factor eIF-1A [Nanoarchaeota archaeon]|nr:translation initiation factor eIF-1A [Nanoarchaeota archaeon]MBU4124341.1 translation initiation factor eIF-1A [Nanoarchaeota archaeon]
MLNADQEQQEIARIKMPRGNEQFGIVTAMLGAGKLHVDCEDGKKRLGRIIGKIKKRVWIRAGDLVILTPWVVQSDEKCDIKWKYTNTQANYLKRTGKIKFEQ